MSFTIRQATVEDAPLIAQMSRQTFYDSFAADNTKEDMEKFLNEQFTYGKLLLEVGAMGNTFLLISDGAEVIGYAKLREGRTPSVLQTNNAMEIARLYILEHRIGTGAGAQLMRACIELAKERGREVVWLGVWEKNPRAIRFYTRWGFEKFDEVDFLLGDDLQRDWLMKKLISPAAG